MSPVTFRRRKGEDEGGATTEQAGVHGAHAGAVPEGEQAGERAAVGRSGRGDRLPPAARGAGAAARPVPRSEAGGAAGHARRGATPPPRATTGLCGGGRRE